MRRIPFLLFSLITACAAAERTPAEDGRWGPRPMSLKLIGDRLAYSVARAAAIEQIYAYAVREAAVWRLGPCKKERTALIVRGRAMTAPLLDVVADLRAYATALESGLTPAPLHERAERLLRQVEGFDMAVLETDHALKRLLDCYGIERDVILADGTVLFRSFRYRPDDLSPLYWDGY